MEKENKQSFFKKQDWFLSAGLVAGIYVIMVIFVYRFRVEATNIEHLVHFLPVVSILMVWIGVRDKKKKEQEEAERKKARYERRKETVKAKKANNK